MLQCVEPNWDGNPASALTATVLLGATAMATHRSTAKRNAWARVRICDTCGKEEQVRKDNASTRCLSCASKERHEKGMATVRARAVKAVCETCGSEFHSSASKQAKGADRYCSRACRPAGVRVERSCKQCKNSFMVIASLVSEKTNSSGNFCCRACYEQWLCKTDRVTGRGSQWFKARTEALRRNRFCAMCGTTKNLEVHHVLPFRISRNNEQINLVPLCKKHHTHVEMIFREIETDVSDAPGETMFIFGELLRERQDATRMFLKSLWKTLAEKRAST